LRIHALQTGTVAIKQSQRVGRGAGMLRLVNVFLDPVWTEPLPIYAWAIEHPEGLIVVDTGETAKSTQPGYFPWWHPYFRNVRTYVEAHEEIDARLRALNLAADDVRWLVMTHLHTDHAGGLRHFPKAEILIARAEYQAATSATALLNGYLTYTFPDWLKPRLVDDAPTPFGAFPNSLPLTRAGDVVIVPTPGHTAGHQSVVVQDGDTAVMLAGDVSYTQAALLAEQLDGVSPDAGAARATLARVHRHIQDHPTVYLPSHDPDSAARLSRREAAR
jgi:glyoxylase-like metal-dependent hydrolase (beta-lactamase superfamily II)